MPNKPESVHLWVDIYLKPGSVEFCVMQTPALLWDILPQKPQPVLDDSHYFKRFTAKYAGKVYEFTFYHVRRT